MTNKSPKCARCGHTRRRHVISEVNGSCQCTAICNCTDYVEPKTEHAPVGNYIAEQYEAGLEAAQKKFFATDSHEGMRQPTLKCAREGCGHYYGNHPKIDDHEKQQAHWVCIECDCKEFTFPQMLEVNVMRRALELGDSVPKEEEALGSWEHDPVNHPSHYTAYPGVEVIQLTRHMSFNRGNAVKYVARAGLKNKDTEVQDLEKAIWYLQDEVKLLRGEHEG